MVHNDAKHKQIRRTISQRSVEEEDDAREANKNKENEMKMKSNKNYCSHTDAGARGGGSAEKVDK